MMGRFYAFGGNSGVALTMMSVMALAMMSAITARRASARVGL